MTRTTLEPGFDPRIADWLEADPDRAPDAVLETVLAAFPSIPQRRALRAPWRFRPMSMPARLVAAVIAIAVVAVGGVILMRPGDGDVGRTQPSALPSPTIGPSAVGPSVAPSVQPTPLPSPSIVKLSAAGVGRVLPAGLYQLDGFAVPVNVTLTAGWLTREAQQRNNVALRNDAQNAFLAFVIVNQVYPDPCHTAQAPVAVGPRVDDLVAAFSAMNGFQVLDLKDVTIGGATGKSFTLTNAIDTAAKGCDGQALTIGTYDKGGSTGPVLEGAGEPDAVWALDVGGTTVLIGGPEAIINTLSFPDAGASASTPAMIQQVSSASGHVTIHYPIGWIERGPSSADAPGSIGAELPGATPNTPDAVFTAAAVALPNGQTASGWLAAQTDDCPGPGMIPHEIAVGGHPGTLLASTCPILGGRTHFRAVVVVNGRGYTFHMDSRRSDIDEAWFAALLSSVSFTS